MGQGRRKLNKNPPKNGESNGSDSAKTQTVKLAKSFAAFDIDGTLIRWQLYHAIADATLKLGYVAPYTYQVVKNARMKWKRRTDNSSFKHYEKQLITTYEQVLKELTKDQLLAAADMVFEEYKDQVYTYTRDLISKLKRKNYLLFAISGSQIEIVEKIARYWGFNDWVGTIYEYRGERFTGNKIVGSADKAKALQKLIAKYKVSASSSVAVGDSGSDIPMLKMAEQPIAFNPEMELFAYAKKVGWKIVIERKNMVYELEKVHGRYQVVKTNA
jgi:HAD superfamily hydrolase (TIGR01490 family)